MPSSVPTQPKDRYGFEVAIICALREESDAVEASFDGFWELDDYDRPLGDSNTYTFGWIGRHNVVLTYLPGMGQTASAGVSALFRSSFPNIRLGLLVGVCGGIPQPVDLEHGIFLGDVIISTDIVQTHLGRQYDDRFVPKDTLQDSPGRQNAELRSFLRRLQGWHSGTKLRNQTRLNIKAIGRERQFRTWTVAPTENEDQLFSPSYRHKHHDPASGCQICAQCFTPYDPVCETALRSTCSDLGCSEQYLVSSTERRRPSVDLGSGSDGENRASVSMEQTESHTTANRTEIYFGTIISGNSVIKSASHRDQLAGRYKAFAIEMEGAGVWDTFPTIIVKGVCDYADSHKMKAWQKYASVTAAAVTKALLTQWSGIDRAVEARPSASSSMRSNENSVTGAFVFNNHAGVQNQAMNQTIHGGMMFGGGTMCVSPLPTFSGQDSTSQTSLNAGHWHNDGNRSQREQHDGGNWRRTEGADRRRDTGETI